MLGRETVVDGRGEDVGSGGEVVEVAVVGGGGCAVEAEAAAVVEDEDGGVKVGVRGGGGRAVEADGEAGGGIDGDIVGADAGERVDGRGTNSNGSKRSTRPLRYARIRDSMS